MLYFYAFIVYYVMYISIRYFLLSTNILRVILKLVAFGFLLLSDNVHIRKFDEKRQAEQFIYLFDAYKTKYFIKDVKNAIKLKDLFSL